MTSYRSKGRSLLKAWCTYTSLVFSKFLKSTDKLSILHRNLTFIYINNHQVAYRPKVAPTDKFLELRKLHFLKCLCRWVEAGEINAVDVKLKSIESATWTCKFGATSWKNYAFQKSKTHRLFLATYTMRKQNKTHII